MVEQAYSMADGGQRGIMRAADADRERVVELLKTAYGEGRLSKDEYDTRVETALVARTYGDLDRLTADLPVAREPVATPAAGVNGFAVASLVCGLAQLVFGPLTTIPAVVLGHMARGQIKRSGEQGAGLALAGLVLGWSAVVLAIFFVVGMAVAFANTPT